MPMPRRHPYRMISQFNMTNTSMFIATKTLPLKWLQQVAKVIWQRLHRIVLRCHGGWGPRQTVPCTWYSASKDLRWMYNKKLSYRWQTAQHLFIYLLIVHAVLSRAALWWMTAIYWHNFLTFTYPYHWTPSMMRIPSSYLVHIWDGKLEWLGYNLVKVTWWSTQSFGHNTSTSQTHRQPRRHSKCHVYTLVSGSKTDDD